MTRQQAHQKARRISKKRGTEIFVVYEPGEGWQIATEFDLHTFYQGLEAEAVYFHGGYLD